MDVLVLASCGLHTASRRFCVHRPPVSQRNQFLARCFSNFACFPAFRRVPHVRPLIGRFRGSSRVHVGPNFSRVLSTLTAQSLISRVLNTLTAQSLISRVLGTLTAQMRYFPRFGHSRRSIAYFPRFGHSHCSMRYFPRFGRSLSSNRLFQPFCAFFLASDPLRAPAAQSPIAERLRDPQSSGRLPTLSRRGGCQPWAPLLSGLESGASGGHAVENIAMVQVWMVGNRRAPGADYTGGRARVPLLPIIPFCPSDRSCTSR